MIIEIKGDILDTDCPMIAHGVNCQGVMGSGVAKVLLDAYPGLREKYVEFCDDKLANGWAESDLLGLVFTTEINGKQIANCFTQQNFGSDGQVYLNYDALHHCIVGLVMQMQEMGIKEVAIPRIGCGLAGGDWNLVKQKLNIFFNDTSDFTVKVYTL